MAKASIDAPNGTKVVVEGAPEELNRILSLYLPIEKGIGHELRKESIIRTPLRDKSDRIEIQDLVNSLKGFDDFDGIARAILDEGSMLHRVLLPLLVAHRSFPQNIGLTSGEVARFLAQFNIKIEQSNVAKTISNEGSKYVIGDRVRVKGRKVRYKISRAGIQFIESLIKT